jgi:predicted transposase/invertase (TIGR01784 family)
MTEDEYFNHLRHRINEVLDRDGRVITAIEALMSITDDEAERARLVSEYKYVVDTQSKVVHARREGLRRGRREGKEEGLREGRIETARNALSKGLPLDIISEITGLDIKTIQDINA